MRLPDLYRLMRRIRAFQNAAEVASQSGVAEDGEMACQEAVVRNRRRASDVH